MGQVDVVSARCNPNQRSRGSAICRYGVTGGLESWKRGVVRRSGTRCCGFLEMNGVKLAVARVVGIEDKVDEPVRITYRVSEFVKDSVAPVPPIEVQISGEFP